VSSVFHFKIKEALDSHRENGTKSQQNQPGQLIKPL